MTVLNQQTFLENWTILGGPDGGTVLAIAIGDGPQQTAFIATEVGIYRSHVTVSGEWNWERLTDLPGGATAIALSCDFSKDRTLIVGTSSGPFVSFDGGDTWRLGTLPRTSSHVIALAVSPQFTEDRIAFAGTLEDGILISTDRGCSWAAWNFGLYDLEVLALAVSPNFAVDEAVFASTTTGLFYSYNGGRAWRELDFPAEAQPILSLAVSPGFAGDGIVYAGTESAGIFLSNNRGQSWQSLESSLAVSCVNAIVFDGDAERIFVAADDAIYYANDGGKHCRSVLDVPGILCLAVNRTIGLAGIGFDGEPGLLTLTTKQFAAL